MWIDIACLIRSYLNYIWIEKGTKKDSQTEIIFCLRRLPTDIIAFLGLVLELMKSNFFVKKMFRSTF